MRLFLALMLPDDLRETLGVLVRTLSKADAQVKWVTWQNIHLTLKFLGEVEEERLHQVHEVSRLAAKGVRPFQLKAEGVGAFPGVRRPKVIWVGLTPSSRLTVLYGRIEDGFRSIGFPAEKKSWSPHLTIGRVKSNRNIRRLEAELSQAVFHPYTFLVDGIHIVRSTLRPEGPLYDTLKRIPLELESSNPADHR